MKFEADDLFGFAFVFSPVPLGGLLALLIVLAGCGSASVISTRELAPCPDEPPPETCVDRPPLQDATHEEALETVVRLEDWGQGCARETDAWRWASRVCRTAAAKTRR